MLGGREGGGQQAYWPSYNNTGRTAVHPSINHRATHLMECLYADEAGASRILERLSSSTRASRRCASALQRGCKTGAGFVRQQQPGKVAKVHAGLAPLRLCVGRNVEDSLTTSGPEDYHASALANHKERSLVGRKGCLLATAGPQLRLQPRTEPSSRNCCNQPFVLGGARPQSIPRPTDSNGI